MNIAQIAGIVSVIIIFLETARAVDVKDSENKMLRCMACGHFFYFFHIEIECPSCGSKGDFENLE